MFKIPYIPDDSGLFCAEFTQKMKNLILIITVVPEPKLNHTVIITTIESYGFSLMEV